LCNRCKKNNVVDGILSCSICADKQKTYAKTRRNKLKQKNICTICACNIIKNENGVYCESCLNKFNVKRKEKYQDGTCNRCNVNECISGRKCCKECSSNFRTKAKKRRDKKREIGLCIKCGTRKATTPHVKCDVCLNKQKKYWHTLTNKRQKNKLCIDCGGTRSYHGKFCETCYLKKRAIKFFSDVTKWVELKNLFVKQNGKCPYTGRLLTIGVDAELDHIVAKSKGGDENINNLQWTYAPVNTMKWNWNESDFLTTIKEIYEYRLK
jgi:hypothetical protein